MQTGAEDHRCRRHQALCTGRARPDLPGRDPRSSLSSIVCSGKNAFHGHIGEIIFPLRTLRTWLCPIMSRSDAPVICGNTLANKNWELLFKLMEMLAKRYGYDNVRMVVWFIG